MTPRIAFLLLYTLVVMGDCADSLASDPGTVPLIGYTELRTNLPGGRYANVRTMRAMVVKSDGTGRRLVAEELSKEPDTSTQFAGWSPDGKTAIIGVGWQSAENAKWEEENKQFRMVEAAANSTRTSSISLRARP